MFSQSPNEFLMQFNKLYIYRRAAATICPRPSPPSVGAEVPRATELTATHADHNVAASSFPWPIRSHSHHCSYLMHQRRGE